MPSIYLLQADYANYGVPAATTAAQATQASVLIDAYLRRKEGVLWVPDAQGRPCYMQGADAQYQVKLVSSISPGQNVVATVSGPASQLQKGDVLIADRANAANLEALTVGSVNGQAVTFVNVELAHATDVILEAGLVIEEQKYMPSGRPITVLSRTPLLRILSGVGRYGFGRRGDASRFNVDQFNLLASVNQFGGPPAWEAFSAQTTNFDSGTGQLWVPAGIMLAYYNEIRVRYVAGYAATAIPGALKLACANIINATTANQLAGATKSYKAGDTQIQKFAASNFDDDTKRILDPYRSALFV